MWTENIPFRKLSTRTHLAHTHSLAAPSTAEQAAFIRKKFCLARQRISALCTRLPPPQQGVNSTFVFPSQQQYWGIFYMFSSFRFYHLRFPFSHDTTHARHSISSRLLTKKHKAAYVRGKISLTVNDDRWAMGVKNSVLAACRLPKLIKA